MVRYHWHVEDGHGCLVPPGKLSCSQTQGVLHAGIQFEIAGQSGLVEALITAPTSYLEVTKDVGVALAHGQEADDWKGPLMNSLAECLAKEGYVVVRYYCKQKEQRRQRIFEKALDACATSPFARHVARWVLTGVGNGARVAAAVGTRCRGNMAGFILIGYPLKEPMPSNKGGPAPDSNMPSRDKRMVYMQELNVDFQTVRGFELPRSVISDLCTVFLEYLWVVCSQSFSLCTIPRLSKIRVKADVQAFQSVDQADCQLQKSCSPKGSSASDQEPSRPLGNISPSVQHVSSNELATRASSSTRPGFIPEQLSYHLPQYPQYHMGLQAGRPGEAELLSHESFCGLDNVSGSHPNLDLSLQIRGTTGSNVTQEELQKSISSKAHTIAISLPNGNQGRIGNQPVSHESPDPSNQKSDHSMEPVALGLNSQLEPGIDFGNELGAFEERT